MSHELDNLILPNRYGDTVKLHYYNTMNDLEYYSIEFVDNNYGVRVSLIEDKPNHFSFIDWSGGKGYYLNSTIQNNTIKDITFIEGYGYLIGV